MRWVAVAVETDRIHMTMIRSSSCDKRGFDMHPGAVHVHLAIAFHRVSEHLLLSNVSKLLEKSSSGDKSFSVRCAFRV